MLRRNSNDKSSKLITFILELFRTHLGNAVILNLEEWQDGLKNLILEDLKLIYLFFLFFDYEHEPIDWKKLLLIKEEIVCVMFSNITTFYILKNRLVKISEYFRIILDGPFKKNYRKLNNLYFIYIENDENFLEITIKTWSKIIENQDFPISDTGINDNKEKFLHFYIFFGINLKELSISEYLIKNIFGNENEN